MSYEDEEAALLSQLAELREKKRNHEEAERVRKLEEERIAAESKIILIRAISFTGGMVQFHDSEFREDIVQLWRSVPGRMYRGTGDNAVPIVSFEDTITRLRLLKNVTVEVPESITSEVHNYLHAPVWNIELRDRDIKVTPGPRYNHYILANIPGCEWQGFKVSSHRYFLLPLSEAWRLFDVLKDAEGVVWTDEARDFTIKQIEARSKIDTIGMAEDWEYDAGFIDNYALRPNQRVGAAFIEATGGNTLLAYDMGMGKTPISLAYAWKNKLRTVVVCPASLKGNWARQILKFTGQHPNIFTGRDPSNHDLITMLTSPSIFSIINYDILGRKEEFKTEEKKEDGRIVVSNNKRYFWVEAINMSKPDLIICDESHYIKNTDSNRSQAVRMMKCPRIIHMTGTPVLNRPGELWPILTMVAPTLFPAEETFIRHYTNNGKTAKNVKELKEALKSVMIRRKQDRSKLNRVIESHDLSPKAKKIYDRVLQGVYEKLAAYSAQGQSSTHSVTNILVQIQRLKQVCAIDKVDRAAELAIELYDSSEGERHRKVVIFTQFKATCYAIAQRLGHEALSVVSRRKYDFNTADLADRDRLKDDFQSNDKIKYLCVTEKTFREGHDLTEAGFVIFNDLFWTPAAHEQAEARAYMRENDPHGISSYYIVTNKEDGEIEDYIMELLRMKEGVIAATVEAVEDARSGESIASALIEKLKNNSWRKE